MPTSTPRRLSTRSKRAGDGLSSTRTTGAYHWPLVSSRRCLRRKSSAKNGYMVLRHRLGREVNYGQTTHEENGADWGEADPFGLDASEAREEQDNDGST